MQRIFKTMATSLAVVLVSMGLSATPAYAFSQYLINPCTADPATTCDGLNPSQVYTPTAPARNQLAVFVGGTKSIPNEYDELSQTLAAHGYHVINLRYTDSTSINDSCTNSIRLSDPDCHRKFRAESMWGENVPDPSGIAYDSPYISVSRANSIANRLLKLVNYLATTSPYSAQGWGQFRDTGSFNSTYGADNLVWSLTAIGGHSQGAGVGLYAAKFYDLLRVVMFAGPQDSWSDSGQIYLAPWIAQGGFVTPMVDIFGFANDHDSLFPRQTAAWAALPLPGALTSVSIGYPYGNSHRLYTTSGSAICAHSSVATDACTPGNPPEYAPVWNYAYDGA